MAAQLAAARLAPPDGRSRRARLLLADGARTTVYVACHDAAVTEIKVALLGGQRLEPWCAERGVREALVGGFFTRPDGLPLGELRMSGVERRYVPFDPPWHAVRACVHVQGGRARIARRDLLPPAPVGDLLQAGPTLVAGGSRAFDPEADTEGFRAGAHQFDPDITAGRHPRAALGLADGRILAVATDGRGHLDSGLTLAEFADLMLALGCEDAINLDGGGSTTLISDGRLRNRPRGDYERPEPGGRPITTALLFVPRLSQVSPPRPGAPHHRLGRVCSRPGHDSFTEPARRDGARVLPAWWLRARRAQPRTRAGRRRLGRDRAIWLGHAPGRAG